MITEGPADDLDHSSEYYRYSGKLGIDATEKIEGEPRVREWPNEIKMDKEIVEYVNKNWESYGFTNK